MRIIIVIFCLLTGFNWVNAQDKEVDVDIDISINRDTLDWDTIGMDTLRRPDHWRTPRYPKVDTRFGMLDYGISTYTHKGSLNLPTELNAVEQRLIGSFNFNLHLIRQIVRLDSIGRINLDYGVSMDFHRYRFNNDATIQAKQDIVTFLEEPGVTMKKNTLNYQMLNVPIYLTFKFKPKKRRLRASNHFRLSVGGHAGIVLSSWTKNKPDGGKKTRKKDDFNLNRVRYGLSARFGYGYFNVFMNYSLSPLFKESEQGIYDLKPFSFGVALIPW